MSKDVSEIIGMVRNEPSSNGKQAILRGFKDHPLIEKTMRYAYCPFTRFYLKGDRLTQSEFLCEEPEPFETVFASLDLLSIRAATGGAALNLMGNVIDSLSADDAELVKDILNKDLRCGVSVSTINKVWPGLIKTMPLMKCADAAKDAEAVANIKFPAYSQLKVDAARCVATVTPDGVTFLTSSGNEFTGLDILAKFILGILPQSFEPFILDGELLQKGMDRKKSNGIANKAVRGTIDESEAENFQFIIWDTVPMDIYFNEKEYDVEYHKRFAHLFSMGFNSNNNERVHVVENHIVENFEEANAINSIMYERGEEGTILKNVDGKWENRRSREAIKYKEIQEIDLLITDVEMGTGRNANRLGNIVCTSADGVINVSVGTGFSDSQREEYWAIRNRIIGKVVTVRYNQRVDDSLFLPRFVEIRYDKNEPDDSSRA